MGVMDSTTLHTITPVVAAQARRDNGQMSGIRKTDSLYPIRAAISYQGKNRGLEIFISLKVAYTSKYNLV